MEHVPYTRQEIVALLAAAREINPSINVILLRQDLESWNVAGRRHTPETLQAHLKKEIAAPPPRPIKTSFGDDLRELRYLAKLSQQKLADAVGVSKAAVSAWELDQLRPSTEHFERMCDVLALGQSTRLRLSQKPSYYIVRKQAIIENPETHTFAQLLNAHRKREGITQAQLAEAIEVPATMLSSWESGASYPSEAQLIMLGAQMGLEDKERRALESKLTEERLAMRQAVIQHPEKHRFGMVLEAYRLTKRCTQVELAKAANVKEKQVERWEACEIFPDAKQFIKIERHLQLEEAEKKALGEAYVRDFYVEMKDKTVLTRITRLLGRMTDSNYLSVKHVLKREGFDKGMAELSVPEEIISPLKALMEREQQRER